MNNGDVSRTARNEIIALWGVIIAAIAGIIVPIILHLIKKKGGHSQRVDVGRINGNGTAIGDNPVVTIDKRQGIDGELVLSKVIAEAEAKGRAEQQIEQLKDELAKAVERIKKLEAEGNRPDAEKALEELRESGDMRRLQELLIKDREEHRDALIQRNREIAAVAYLRGDIDIASEAINEIIKELPEDISALNQKGHINRLRGRLKEAEDCYRRMLQLGSDVNDEAVKAVALGNLGLIYKTKGDLVMAEDMLNKSLEINKKLGRLEGMARDYGNLGSVYYMKGDVDKAEEMHKKALEIDEKVDHLEGVARHLANIGLVYEQRGNVPKARKYWEKALGLYKKIGMPREIEKVEGWIEGIGKGKK